MSPSRLAFSPIDLDTHAHICVAFRRDSYICSFGVDAFLAEAGPNGVHYLERLRMRTTKFPDGYVHVWQDDKLVGQMEMQILDEPRRGYVNLFYLVEEMRGAGVSWELQEYAMEFMRRHQAQVAQLSVSPTNARACAFYRKHGWRDLGLRPGRDNVHLMECDVRPLITREDSESAGRGA
jgi:ribosomal protein S18 acetylase RimI-like enzyme